MARQYPEAARSKQIGGAALIRCKLDKKGVPRGCLVLAETPAMADFGAASVKISDRFKAAAPKKGEPSLEGRAVRIPIVWTTLGGARPETAWYVGDAASLVTVATSDQPGGFICASASQPKRRCLNHPFKWTARPTFNEVVDVIQGAGQTSGLAQLNCAVAQDGSLIGCVTMGNIGEPAKAAMLALAPTFKVPARANDGTAASAGRVFVTFDWAVLSAVYVRD